MFSHEDIGTIKVCREDICQFYEKKNGEQGSRAPVTSPRGLLFMTDG